MRYKTCTSCARPFQQDYDAQRQCRTCQPRRPQSPTRRARKGTGYSALRRKILTGEPPCYWCGEEVATTMDHVIAVANGGETVESNVVPACEPCNRAHAADPNWVPPRKVTHTPPAIAPALRLV